MANILLTTRCVRSCPYCFARREMENSPPREALAWDDLIYLADFLQASGERHVSLLGGEPTLHPDLVDMVLYLVERRFNVTVFTSGIMTPARLEELGKYLTPLPLQRLTLVCNLNDPQQTPAAAGEEAKVRAFLEVLGPWTMPGFNIYRPDFSLEFLFDLINRYGMKRQIRLGIAHPVPGLGQNLMPPEQIGAAVSRFLSYRPLFDRYRVKPGLDCGFPLCRFSDEELGWFFRSTGRVTCGCAPAMDITPDMSVYACFPLSDFHRKSIFEFDSLGQARDYFMGQQNRIRNEIAGIYEECDGCVHREEGRCAGGGACQLLTRFVGEARVRMEEIESELPKSGLSV